MRARAPPLSPSLSCQHDPRNPRANALFTDTTAAPIKARETTRLRTKYRQIMRFARNTSHEGPMHLRFSGSYRFTVHHFDRSFTHERVVKMKRATRIRNFRNAERRIIETPKLDRTKETRLKNRAIRRDDFENV